MSKRQPTDKEIIENTMWLEKKVYKQWYHTIDLGDKTTDGIFDLRGLKKFYGFPNLKGKRVLDVGCGDGFFSFEFEKMGAAEVVALDAYKNDYFLKAKKKLNSNVKYLIMDVYNIHPKKIGFFDFVFCGTVLLHLTDPFKALRNIRSVIKEGEFICANPIFKIPLITKMLHLFEKKLRIALLIGGRPKLADGPTYWYPTEDCLREMIYKAGFDHIEKISNFTLKGYTKAGHRKEFHPHVVFRMMVNEND